MKKYILTGVVAVALIVAACLIYTNKNVGGDSDEYGCKQSAGYSWCEAKKTCIRTWEEYCTVTQPKKAFFGCDESKAIMAVFYPGDDKFVDLALSDERKMSVPRAISASARAMPSRTSRLFSGTRAIRPLLLRAPIAL